MSRCGWPVVVCWIVAAWMSVPGTAWSQARSPQGAEALPAGLPGGGPAGDQAGVDGESSADTGDAALRRLRAVIALSRLGGGDASDAAARYGVLMTLRDVSGVAYPDPANAGGGATDTAGRRGETPGAPGGGAMADFGSLMQLIQTTIVPDAWEDVGGPSTMFPYPQGILVDPRRTVSFIDEGPADEVAAWRQQVLSALSLHPIGAAGGTWPARTPRPLRPDENAWRSPAAIRCVSLAGWLRAGPQAADGRPPSEAWQHLAGLSAIRFVWVGDHDVWIAGPVGGIERRDGWLVDRDTGHGISDWRILATCLAAAETGQAFGCSIDPTPEGLKRAIALGDDIRSGQLQITAASEPMRQALGRQRVDLFGLAHDTAVASLLVEADRHMKRLAIGDQPMPAGVRNYRTFVNRFIDQGPPDGLLLRLWFTAHPIAVRGDPRRGAYEMAGPVMRLSGENERAVADGERGHVTADPRTEAFVQEFNRRFHEIRDAYPVYAALETVYRSAALAELLRRAIDPAAPVADLLRQIAVAGASRPEAVDVPREVESIVAGHSVRSGRQRHQLLIASGGVWVDPRETLPDEVGQYPVVSRDRVEPRGPAARHWWWDVPPGE